MENKCSCKALSYLFELELKQQKQTALQQGAVTGNNVYDLFTQYYSQMNVNICIALPWNMFKFVGENVVHCHCSLVENRYENFVKT